jgi:hypothetical protein
MGSVLHSGPLGRSRTLIARRPVQHTENLEDVAVAVIAVELVACAVKTEHNLPRLSVGAGSPWVVVCSDGSDGAGWKVSREKFFTGVKLRVYPRASGPDVAIMATGSQVELVHRVH